MTAKGCGVSSGDDENVQQLKWVVVNYVNIWVYCMVYELFLKNVIKCNPRVRPGNAKGTIYCTESVPEETTWCPDS